MGLARSPQSMDPLHPQIYGGYQQEGDEILRLSDSGLSAPYGKQMACPRDDGKLVKRIIHCKCEKVEGQQQPVRCPDTSTEEREELLPLLGPKGQGQGAMSEAHYGTQLCKLGFGRNLPVGRCHFCENHHSNFLFPCFPRLSPHCSSRDTEEDAEGSSQQGRREKMSTYQPSPLHSQLPWLSFLSVAGLGWFVILILCV